MSKYDDSTEETNLIDLKDDDDFNNEDTNVIALGDAVDEVDDDDASAMFDFSKLKWIENPNSPMSRGMLPQTLEDCVGCLKELPLVKPNADQQNPATIVDMVNILSLPEAEGILETAYASSSLDYDAEPMVSLLKKSRQVCVHTSAPLNFGHVVRPGCISFYTKYGVVYAVPEGKWWLPSATTKWINGSKNVSLDQDVIRAMGNQVLIIRIIEGQYGLVTIQGVHHILDVGTHVFNSGTVQFNGTVTYSDTNYFNHGPYHYMNVPRGKFAKVWVEAMDADGVKSLVPRLIKEGEHFVKSTFFQFKGLIDVSTEYIGHDSMHVLNVLKGQVAKVFQDNSPRILGEGLHVIESTNFSYEGAVLIEPDNLCIEHGTITILQVPRGKIALAWNMNEPCFIDKPGLHEFNNNNFHFVGFVDASERKIELGSKKIIQVYTGEVGITYDKGELRVLESGRHIIDSSMHIFERFLSTKQRSIRLITYGANHKIGKATPAEDFANFDDDSDLLVCETKDLVKVGVRADVFYSIRDPDKCIKTLNTDELEDLVRETAVATLTNIIRSTALNQIAQSKQISASAGPEAAITAVTLAEGEEGSDEDIAIDNEEQQKAAAVTYFFDRAHDEFMAKLHEDFVSRYGVDIANIRMESFKIMDTELAGEIAQNCLTTAHVENELANLEGQNLIATQKERTGADCQNIKAAAEAKSLKICADAENKRKIDAAKAEAESMKLKAMAKAQAEADSILLKAKAEAEAIRLKAVAEAERAKLLSQTVLGQQQCLLEQYADMVKTSNQGVNKVVYMDPSINRDSPFALGSLDGLNRDLHSLSKLGLAANGENIVEAN